MSKAEKNLLFQSTRKPPVWRSSAFSRGCKYLRPTDWYEGNYFYKQLRTTPVTAARKPQVRSWGWHLFHYDPDLYNCNLKPNNIVCWIWLELNNYNFDAASECQSFKPVKKNPEKQAQVSGLAAEDSGLRCGRQHTSWHASPRPKLHLWPGPPTRPTMPEAIQHP